MDSGRSFNREIVADFISLSLYATVCVLAVLSAAADGCYVDNDDDLQPLHALT